MRSITLFLGGVFMACFGYYINVMDLVYTGTICICMGLIGMFAGYALDRM